MPVEIYSPFWLSMYTTNYTTRWASAHVRIEQASINVTFTLIDALCFSIIKNVSQFGPTQAGVVPVFTGMYLCGPYACIDAVPLILKEGLAFNETANYKLHRWKEFFNLLFPLYIVTLPFCDREWVGSKKGGES